MRAHPLPAFLFASLLVVPCLAQSGPCASDDDCVATEQCLLSDVDEADCPPDQDCPVAQEESTGWCYPRPVRCDADADCPEPTRCNDDGECEYVLEVCDSSAMCDARYVCTDLGGGTECASSDPAGDADDPGEGDSGEGSDVAASSEGAAPVAEDPKASDPGASDPEVAPDPLPQEDSAEDDSQAPPGVEQSPEAEDCAPREPTLVCFPRVERCEDDADCEGDWTCEALPDDGPGDWSGVEKACLPPGLVGVLDGSIEVGGSGVAEDGASGEGSGAAPGDEDDLVDDGDVTEPSSDPVGLGTQGGSEGSSGCAVRGRNANGWLLWSCSVLGLALLRRRRRRLG